MPKELIQSTKLEELKKLRKPAFIPVNPETDATKLHDEETGITRRRLANGIPVNYKVFCEFILRFSWVMILVPYFPLLCHCDAFSIKGLFGCLEIEGREWKWGWWIKLGLFGMIWIEMRELKSKWVLLLSSTLVLLTYLSFPYFFSTSLQSNTFNFYFISPLFLFAPSVFLNLLIHFMVDRYQKLKHKAVWCGWLLVVDEQLRVPSQEDLWLWVLGHLVREVVLAISQGSRYLSDVSIFHWLTIELRAFFCTWHFEAYGIIC